MKGAPGRTFEALILPLLDSAYNLARWLLRNDASAEDAVQEAVLRAMRHFGHLRGDDARPWFLAIVRNVCFTQLSARAEWREVPALDSDALDAMHYAAGLVGAQPSDALQQTRERALINAAIRALPEALREIVILRELEELSYEQIAVVAAIPVGTVMSRLSRARARLRELLIQYGVRG